VGRGALLLKLELRSNPEALCAVRGALGNLVETLGFPEEECRSVVRAVDEALANIIRHAYNGQDDQPIEVNFRRIEELHAGLHREALEILMEDHGVPVDKEKLQGRDLDDVKPGGLGLHFIRDCMDAVEFRRSEGKNQLRLVKYLRIVTPNPMG
jgi:anti-sigma regulatory factor (Ser/Thr protein kinase)